MIEERLPPNNVSAEEAVLGSIFVDPECLDDISGIVSPLDFYREKNAWVYEACLACRGMVNQITVAQELIQKGRLEAVGGGGYLSLLVERLPTSVHAEYYADIVHRLADCRRLISGAGQIAAIGYEAETDWDAAYAKVRQIIDRLAPKGASNLYDPQAQAEIIMAMLSRKDRDEVIKSGYPNLDRLTGGMPNGTLNTFASRPRVGKTQLALEIARHNVLRDNTTLYASAEMTVEQLEERVVAMETGIEIIRLSTGRITEDEGKKVSDVAADVAAHPLYVLAGGITPESVLHWAKRLKERNDLRLLVFDYVQIAARGLGHAYGPDLRQRVGYLTAFLKRIAIELNIPVIAVSQINRTPEAREDKRPRIEEMKESSNLEEDSDTIILLHRPELAIVDLYERRKSDKYGVMEVHVAKHRQLGIDERVDLFWQSLHHRYGEVDTKVGEPYAAPRQDREEQEEAPPDTHPPSPKTEMPLT